MPLDVPSPSPTPPAVVCPRVTIAIDAPIRSADARAAEPFSFTVMTASALDDGTAVPAGAKGRGQVAVVEHAQRGGRGGVLALETRFVMLPEGRHVPATIDRVAAAPGSALGGSRNIPGLLGAIPGVGWFLGPYGYLHHGSDVTIEKGTTLTIVLGDGQALGTCR